MLEKAPDKRYASMEEAAAGIGAHPLGHDDPNRLQLVELARKGSTREILRQVPPPPSSPVPPAKTRQVVEAATTPVPTPRILSIAVAPGRADLHVGDAMQLTASTRAAGGTAAGGSVSWASSDPSVATVTATGLVTAVAPGTATVTATADGVSGSAQVGVTRVPVASVVIEPEEARLAVGDELGLKVILKDRHGAAAAGSRRAVEHEPLRCRHPRSEGTRRGRAGGRGRDRGRERGRERQRPGVGDSRAGGPDQHHAGRRLDPSRRDGDAHGRAGGPAGKDAVPARRRLALLR